MTTPEYVQLMAAYTHWQNESVYFAAASLTDTDRREDRGAFFGSIHATLNHLLWGDELWMHRVANTPAPSSAGIADSVSTHAQWDALRTARSKADRLLLEWSAKVTDADLSGNYTWFSAAAQRELCRPRWALVVQLFNHGTHHRGQVHAMLTSAGARPEDTDVQFMPSEYFAWADATSLQDGWLDLRGRLQE